MASVIDRIMNVEMVCLCPQMDIVALVTRDGALLVNRTTSFQRLTTPAEILKAGAISALCWSPDGRLLAVGHCQGDLSMFDVEAEGLLQHGGACWCEEIMHCHKITLVWWAQQICTGSRSSNRDITDSDGAEISAGYFQGNRFLPMHAASAAPGDYNSELSDSAALKASKILSVLVTGDEDGALILSLNGLFPVARLLLDGPAPSAVACCASGDLQTLFVWAQTANGPKLEVFDVKFLSVNQDEVAATMRVFLSMALLIEKATEIQNAAHKAWGEAIGPLDRKLALYDSILQDWHTHEGSSPELRAELLALVMHGVINSATAQFLDDNMAEPSLSRTHKLVHASAIHTEHGLNDELLRAARLLCYYAGELVAYSRLDGAGFRPDAVGLNLGLSRILLREAESLAVSAEVLVSDVRLARASLSRALKWFKALHEAHADKISTSNVVEDALKCKLSATNQREMASLLKVKSSASSLIPHSKTEFLLDFNIAALLDPDRKVEAAYMQGDLRKIPLPESPSAEDIAARVRTLIENEFSKDKPKQVSTMDLMDDDSEYSDCEDGWCDDNSIFLAIRLKAVGAAMRTIFSRTRKMLAKDIAHKSSIQFPGETLEDLSLRERCCFTAHFPEPQADLSTRTCPAPGSYECLQDVSILIKATESKLWLIKSHNHDSMRTCLGFQAPEETRIVQAKFYASQQGSYQNRVNRIAALLQRGGTDEIWLLGDASFLKEQRFELVEPGIHSAFFCEGRADWSNNIYDNSQSLHLRSCNVKVIPLTRARSKRFSVSGCRGMACVLAEPSFLTLYDLEDVETDQEDDDDG